MKGDKLDGFTFFVLCVFAAVLSIVPEGKLFCFHWFFDTSPSPHKARTEG